MDQLREDTRERTWEDYVETAGAALAIGAGAASFLRHNRQGLSRFADYIAGARKSWAEGAFDGFNLERGLNRAKEVARLGQDGIAHVDPTKDSLLQTVFAGHEIRMGGKLKSSLKGSFERGFRVEYGNAALDQMLNSAEHQYMNDDQIKILRNMLEEFAGGEEGRSHPK